MSQTAAEKFPHEQLKYSAGEPRATQPLVLYHSVESACAQKVRLVMSEKHLAWTEVLLNLRKGEQFDPNYLSLNAKGVVPTLVHAGNVIRESTVINEYLDQVFPQPSLKPADPGAQARMRLIVKTVDDDVHPAIGILSYALVLRHQMNELKSPEEMREHFAKVVDPMRRERQRGVHEQGMAAPGATVALMTLGKTLDYLERSLSPGPWLAGETYSLADAAVAPYMVRMDGLRLASLWEGKPKFSAWYQR
ncbi:MAG: glutathione S-transferase family protein, partial [Steroidobacteraceae bacterium]